MDKEEERIQNIIDYHETFNTEHGKRCLADLEKDTKFYKFSKLPKDANKRTDICELAFMEGQRRVVARIKHMLNTNPLDKKKGIKND